MKNELTQERLKELLTYDPATGAFGRVRGRRKCGYTNKRGYVLINIDGRHYYAHRLAWFCTHGEWPTCVDHKNGNPSDNRIENLRAATHGQNNQNRVEPYSRGYRGVSLEPRTGRYTAKVGFNRRLLHFGTYRTAVHAAVIAKLSRIALFGEFAGRDEQ